MATLISDMWHRFTPEQQATLRRFKEARDRYYELRAEVALAKQTSESLRVEAMDVVRNVAWDHIDSELYYKIPLELPK